VEKVTGSLTAATAEPLGANSTPEFQLQRLVLIDSYSPGRVIEFPMTGGAVLTGRNGRGKTTLLQLVPIFFGENPARIVGTETNRLDFNGYYLPRLTSYIIFEYRRRDLLCMVVVHASESGSERRYRFVRGAYRSELFLLPDGRNILQSPDLRRHFKLHGVIHSEAISAVSEYRSIIQGKVGRGKGWQRQRALVAEYAFVGSGHHLTHIEKIVSGMFLRRTDFEDLQRMVVSCIAEGDAEIALTTERRKIASWPEHYEAYSQAMGEAPRMEEALNKESRLIAIEAELSRIHARALRLLAHLEQTDEQNRKQRTQHLVLANEELDAHRQTADGLRIRIDAAARSAHDLEDKVAALEHQRADYTGRDLPAKADLLSREPDLRVRRDQLQGRREALLGEQEKISLQYERLLNDLDRQHNQAERAAAEVRANLAQTFEPRFADIEGQRQAELDRLHQQYRDARLRLDERLQETVEHKGEWKQRARAPEPDAELVALHREKQAALEALRSEHESATLESRRCEQLLSQARAAHQEQEGRLKQLRQQRDELERHLRTLLLQQSPGEDTLLYFLRRRRPDWVFDIAKVVREDLLVRADLSPELLDAVPALYGVGLDLERLEAHLAADEQGLQREVVAIEQRRSQLEEQQDQAQRRLEGCERGRKTADTELGIKRADQQRLATRLESAREETRSAAHREQQSAQVAAAKAKEQLSRLVEQESGLRSQLADLDAGLRVAIEERERQHAGDRRSIEMERDAALQSHDREQAERAQRYASGRAETEAERDRRLHSAGVDTGALKRLEAEMQDIERQLHRAQAARDEVAQWRLWLQHEWPRKQEHLHRAAEARDQEAAERRELAAEDRRWQARSAALSAEQERLDKQHARLEREIAAVRGRLEGFRAYPPDDVVMGQAFDAGWTLDALANQANSMQREAQELDKTIRRLVDAIKMAFSARRDTPPDNFYETHRAILGPDAPARSWVGAFKAWFDSDHDAYRRTLGVEANQIAGAIVAFHRDMEAFHRKVQQFNRELQQSLDDNLEFESVSRVTVEIVSVIRELEYWRAIDEMAEAHRAWLDLQGQELPPPEFAATLRKLLEHWEVREGIRAALPSLIRIQGEVVENGQTRLFRRAADLERVSSHGLSYLILCVIFIAFINRIRRHSRVEIVWALDELKDLDIGNIEALLKILRRNAITLVSAFPDPDAEVLALFRHRFSVEQGRRLMEARVAGLEDRMHEQETADV